MANRKKRLIKQGFGLLKQAQKHRVKLEIEEGRKDTTHDYWEKEIRAFEELAKERIKKMNRLKRSKTVKEK